MVMIAKNLHMFFDSPEIKQAIANGVNTWKSKQCCLVIVAPVLNLPPEIEKLIHVIEMELPTKGEMIALQRDLLNGVDPTAGIVINEDAALAAVGLTELEAETAFAKCLVENSAFKVEAINEIKGQMIKKSGLMEIWEAVDVSAVGGLQVLKDWLEKRRTAWAPGNEHLPKVRAILLFGVPGSGKSLVSKALAKIFNRMLIRMNISDLKNSLVGESERRAREATRIVDAMGQSVVWWDEVEKALGGVKSGAQTGDTTTSMFGHFLTWMEERTSDSIIVATANNIQALPPEFIRRFDQVFFCDLPTESERAAILDIQSAKYDTKYVGATVDIIDALKGYTGAEIEKVVKESLFDGWDNAVKSVSPISRTMKDDIDTLRNWAKKNQAIIANSPEVPSTTIRTISIKENMRAA
jgi:SpoVK/Ycf46/Vps4 family AAA+-type ATPase